MRWKTVLGFGLMGLAALLALGQFRADSLWSGWLSAPPFTQPSGAYGVQAVPAEDVRALVPEWEGQPTLLNFSARLCKDCQRMKPVLARLAQTYQHQVRTVVLDVAEPANRTEEALLQRFQPLVTPTLVLLGPTLQTDDVLVGYQSPDQLEQLYAQLAVTVRTTDATPAHRQGSAE